MLYIREEKEPITTNEVDSPALSKTDYCAKCFLALSLTLANDEPNEMKIKAKEIINYLHEQYPEVGIQFFNFKDGKYSIELQDFFYAHPFITETPLNKECIEETINVIKTKIDYQDKGSNLIPKFFVCIYALIINGWLGTGAEKLSQMEFRKWMEEKGFHPRGRSQFSNKLAELSKLFKFPNWDSEINEAIKNTNFEKEFIKTYWGLMMLKYESFEEMKEVKSE